MDIELSITTASGTVSATKLVPTVTSSGDYKQCARTLDFGLLSSSTDPNIPVVNCPLGAGIILKVDGVTKFNGFVTERTKNTESNTIDIQCYDRGFYVKKNEASYKFRSATPEEIARRVCNDFKIKIGSLATTGIRINRNFIAANLYQIIQTAYTEASKKTGERYQIRFEDDALSVVKKGINSDTVIIKGGVNLMSASVTESITDMVNCVQIVDKDGTVLNTYKDSTLISQYGLLQKQIKKASEQDVSADAKKLLDDNGESQKITINNLGDVGCITGNSIAVYEPYTGLYGLYYIDSDTHTWKNGLYFNKLVINFKKIMDEQDVGEIVK